MADFEGADRWLRQVESYLSRPESDQHLRSLRLTRNEVREVAEHEARIASLRGYSTVSHDDLSNLTRMSRRTIAAARTVLMDAGLEELAAHPSARGEVVRILRLE